MQEQSEQSVTTDIEVTQFYGLGHAEAYKAMQHDQIRQYQMAREASSKKTDFYGEGVPLTLDTEDTDLTTAEKKKPNPKKK